MIISFYDASTGIFTGSKLRVSNSRNLRSVTEPYIEGDFDCLAVMVDLSTMDVISRQFVSPTDTDVVKHHWDDGSKRWVRQYTQLFEDRKHNAALIKSMELDEISNLRALREAVLELSHASSPATDQLRALDARIVDARTKLRKA